MNTINNCPQVLTDQDKIEDLLSEEKYLISGYGTFIPEASCPQLRQVLTQNFTECVQNQYTIFDQMNQLGWYPTKDAPVADVNAAREKFQQMQQQLLNLRRNKLKPQQMENTRSPKAVSVLMICRLA